MKLLSQIWIFALALILFLSSCEIIGDILEVGVWLGIILVVLVVALILWIVRKFRR
jgi:hypothetical protein